MSYKTVFDAGHAGYSTWPFPAFGLMFVCVGALLVFRPALMLEIMPSGPHGRSRAVLAWYLLAFSVLWTIVAFAATYMQYRRVTTTLQKGGYNVVEGTVTDFVPMPYTGHSDESFIVGNRKFSYSDYEVTSGFHNTVSHGGPIKTGIRVRVTYLGNLILRLEVAQ